MAAASSLGVGNGEAHAAAAPADRDDIDADAHADAFGAQAVDDDGGKLGIDLGQGGAAIEHGGVDAEPVEGLGEFEPLAAGAEDDQVGQLAGQVEDGGGGQVVDAVETGDLGRRPARCPPPGWSGGRGW